MTEKRFEGIKIGRRENTPPETIRNEKNSEAKKEQNSKNADCGFTGRFAKRFSGERPDPLGLQS